MRPNGGLGSCLRRPGDVTDSYRKDEPRKQMETITNADLLAFMKA